MCGQKIPVRTVINFKRKTVGAHAFFYFCRPLVPRPQMGGRPPTVQYQRFSQVFLDKGLGISDPPRPLEINLRENGRKHEAVVREWLCQDCGSANAPATSL